MYIIFAFSILLMVLFVVREFAFGYRHKPWIRSIIPKSFEKYQMISFEDWELTDTEKRYNQQVLEVRVKINRNGSLKFGRPCEYGCSSTLMQRIAKCSMFSTNVSIYLMTKSTFCQQRPCKIISWIDKRS